MPAGTAPRPGSATTRRRPHRAPATRILLAGASASAAIGLTTAMSLAAPAGPPADTSGNSSGNVAGQASGSDGQSSTAESGAPRKVIRLEIHKKVYVPTPEATAGSSATGRSSSGSTGTLSPSRTSRSTAS